MQSKVKKMEDGFEERRKAGVRARVQSERVQVSVGRGRGLTWIRSVAP
jgi:hypothetical protein